ncbi:unnamed protein product [Rotaria sordida]|uniref:G-protein coupled receptors family 1 profile domain-containing protein n=1 Tax=Rotaria sordida TaxID=392033 RepID=A0A815QRT1_9BILA|nr:unnamed protein product [Rotaria sordida]
MSRAVDAANDMWSQLSFVQRVVDGKCFSLKKYQNGSKSPRKNESLLIYSLGKDMPFGHVSVIVDVLNDSIRVAEQNFHAYYWSSNYSRQIPYIMKNGSYYIMDNYNIYGWMSVEDSNQTYPLNQSTIDKILRKNISFPDFICSKKLENMSQLANKLLELSILISKFYLILIYLIGLLGNICNIIVFCRDSMRLNSCSWYFLTISIFHIIILTVGCLFRIINYFLGYDISIIEIGFCKFRAYIVVISYILSRYLLCLISIDRWMITSKNVFIRRQCTRKKAQLVIIISIIFWFLIEIFIPIGFNIQGNNCVPSTDPFYLFMYRIIDLLCTLFPFFILIIFSFLTLHNILKRRIIPIDGHTLVTISVSGNNNRHYRTYTNKDYHLIRLCFSQVIVFIILNIPGALFSLYMFITRTNIKTIDHLTIDSFLNIIATNLAYTHCALTFYLYTLTSKEFRKQCSLTFRYIQRRFIIRFQ